MSFLSHICNSNNLTKIVEVHLCNYKPNWLIIYHLSNARNQKLEHLRYKKDHLYNAGNLWAKILRQRWRVVCSQVARDNFGPGARPWYLKDFFQIFYSWTKKWWMFPNITSYYWSNNSKYGLEMFHIFGNNQLKGASWRIARGVSHYQSWTWISIYLQFLHSILHSTKFAHAAWWTSISKLIFFLFNPTN